MNSDSAVPGLNRDAAHSVQISVPPLAEQRRIAHILGTLDDKIELNRRMNATLEAMARALFKSWFVDFDPVHAKTAGHPSGLPLEIEALFPDSFADSELGPIPEGWEVKVFGDFLETKTEKMKGGQSEPYSATNEGLFLRNEKFNKQLSRSLANYKRVDYGDLVFGLSRGILNFGVMKDSIGCVSPVYQVFKINETVYLPLLLEMLMRGQHHYFKDLIKPGSREGQGVDREYLSSKRITVPNMECQKAFDEIRKLLGALIDSNSQEIVTLSGLRDRLLLKLLSGRVSNAYF